MHWNLPLVFFFSFILENKYGLSVSSLIRLVSFMCSIVKLHLNPWIYDPFWVRCVWNSPETRDRTNLEDEGNNQGKEEKKTATSWSSQYFTGASQSSALERKRETPPKSVKGSIVVLERWYRRDQSPTPPYIKESNKRREWSSPILIFCVVV